YVYPAAGTFNMTLTVTDNLGATGSKTASFVVGGGPPVNQPPIADFTYNCVARVPGPGFDCFFNGTASSDPDGTVVGWSWSPPGKPVKTGANVSYVYPTTGTFNMTLTVTDNNGATNTKATPFTVP
ncbi:MAG: PKD domain-containing protein, partial [Gemmatimonadaceae bacterium]